MDSSSQKKPFNRGRSPFHYIQIHLLTAILMMLVAGGLLGVNFVPRRFRTVDGLELQRGWPSVAFADELHPPDRLIWPDEVLYHEWRAKGVLTNVSIALLLLLSVATLSEYLIRCRERERA